MIIRLSQKLATRVKVSNLELHPLAADPQRDWSASAFNVSRAQYILCCNTASLYSWLFPAKGITKPESLLAVAPRVLHQVLEADGMKAAYLARELGGPSSIVRFAKPLNRSVIGSMNDMILHACWGIDEGRPLVQVASGLNDMPMSSLTGPAGERYLKPREVLLHILRSPRDASASN